VVVDEPLQTASETLVRLDCAGEVRPGLASEWTGDSTGRTWIFTVPSAALVASTWRNRGPAVNALGIESALPLDEHRLRVVLGDTPDAAPHLFAHPALAVPRPQDASRTHLQISTGRDPRDALDRGADVVVTRDPAAVDYVARRPEFATLPLPWSRIYALVQPAGAEPFGILSADSVRRSLAEEVAQADARAAGSPFLWTSRCPPTEIAYAGPLPGAPRIVYPRDDRVARGIAERIVALARDSVPLRTAGLPPAEFASALSRQNDRGYVVSFPRHVPAPCHELAELPAGSRVHPLIETRAYALLRKGAAPVAVDWDGAIRAAGP
jgi:hypothetical protein